MIQFNGDIYGYVNKEATDMMIAAQSRATQAKSNQTLHVINF